MTYAIIETGGKQLRVEPGRFYDIDRLPQDPDTAVSIDKVLLVHNGTEATIGQPFVEGATVEATVMQRLRGRKVLVYKMRPKKKTRKKQGHRAELTRLMVDAIHLNGVVIGTSEETAEETTDVTDVAATTTIVPEVSSPVESDSGAAVETETDVVTTVEAEVVTEPVAATDPPAAQADETEAED